MKIAFLHYTCGLIDRGSEISTKILASYFQSKGHKVFIYQLGMALKKENYRIVKVKMFFKPRLNKSAHFIGKVLERIYLDYNSLLSIYFSLKIIPYLLRTKPDVIVPTNGFWQVIICQIIKLFTKSKIIVIGRAGIGWTDKDNIRLKPNLFIALTKKAAIWAKGVDSNIKTKYIPNPINIDSFLRNSSPIKLFLKKPIILTVAALTPYKKIDKLIIACSRLKNISLLIVGKGELYSQLNKMGKKYLKNRFLITTFKYGQMASVYKACDLFVLLSDKREAFGRVFLEAMACGLPVITTDTFSRREIVGQSGFFVKSLDKDVLAKVLQKSLIIKKAKQVKRQAQKFDINKIGPKYEKAFLDLLKE